MYFTLKISNILFSHSFFFCFSCVVTHHIYVLVGVMKKIQSASTKREKLKAEVIFFHLKVTDTKEEYE